MEKFQECFPKNMKVQFSDEILFLGKEGTINVILYMRYSCENNPDISIFEKRMLILFEEHLFVGSLHRRN